MPFALKLLRINIYNTYYTSQVGKDFSLVPDEATQQFMDHHHLRFTSYMESFEMFWLTDKFENPFQIFKDKMAGYQLNFYLELQNPYAINFSLLKVEQGYIYYFTNVNSSQKLHKKTYVSEEDKIPINTSINSLHKAYPDAFGIVNIHLDKLWEKSPQLEQLPIQYDIQIKARETIWRYHIIDLQERIKTPMKVVIDEDDSYFIYIGSPAENKNIHLYESKKPLVLSDKTNQKFSLRMDSKKTLTKAANTRDVLLEKLPLPDVRLLENNVEKGGIFYSDIVVYV